MNFVQISELAADQEYNLQLSYLGEPRGENLRISEIHVHKLGLLLTGVEVTVHPSRIQVLGSTENIYLNHLDPARRQEIARLLVQRGVGCIVLTRNIEPPREFIEPLRESGICLLTTPLEGDAFIERASNFLLEKLTLQISIHGVLVDVLGVGVLLLGKSGIGKSECALDLVHRGHRLVADDLVELVKWRELIIGHCSQLIRHHMEIRGLGIINIQDLYGISAVRERKRVDLVVELIEWSQQSKIDSLGLDAEAYSIMDVMIPHIRLPVLPGKNLSVIIEVAARNTLLKMGGHDSARAFQDKLSREIASVEKVKAFTGEDVE